MRDYSGVRRAAEVLLQGGAVAFPTETVYGLGALATDAKAVARIYRIKGRPSRHPLIVHAVNIEEAFRWVVDVPTEARALARRFWPGPLTLVLRKSPRIPDVTTGGLGSVGIRVPSHPVAQALLYQVGYPVAAPSANRFGKVSPTTAEHVRKDLGNTVDFVLDGGPCSVGVESTIVRFGPEGGAKVLRPGGIPLEDVEAVLGGRIEVGAAGERVSGALPSHYAPRARVIAAPRRDLKALEAHWRRAVHRVVVLRGGALVPDRLYASLRDADEIGADVILAELPPERGLGRAVADRLRKAAGPRM
jgi:L-threonylcarbamoyladenylate synthase